jgi:thiamine biosynthesis lipoprotein
MEDPPADGTVRRMRVYMGCLVHIEARAEEDSRAMVGVESAFAAVAAVETAMHPARPGSDLTTLNAAEPRGTVGVGTDTWELLRLAKILCELTAGAFDPCLPTAPGRISDLELPAEGEVIVRTPVAIDLGGIAKGHAVDRAIDALQTAGCDAGLVNAGGDLRVFGPRAHQVLLRDRDRLRLLSLRERAIAVSDTDAPSAPPEHRGYYLRTGAPTLRSRYAAVVAGEATLADALTKCVLLCPRERASAVLEHFGATLAAIS